MFAFGSKSVMPTSSIIITTHNRPAQLPHAIESARNAGRQVEVVVVDDASRDETAEICRSIPAINYVRVERNQGVAGARNLGLIRSSGDYVSFLDDDDLRLPGSIDQQVRVLAQTPEAAFVYAQAIPEAADGTRRQAYPAPCPQGDILWELLIRNFIPCGSVVFRRAALSQIGLLDDSIPGIDDWDLWLRMAELFPVIAIETPVLVWRQSTMASAQGSSDTLRLLEQGRKHFREAWLRLPRVAAASSPKKKATWEGFSKNIAEHLAWESFSALRQAEINRALGSFWTLAQLHPGAFIHLLRRWARASTLATLMAAVSHRQRLPEARAHFRQIRSNIPR